MKSHGFQGIDLDWEYPVDPDRGGHLNDMANLVQLCADMRNNPEFGRNYGISVTLAPDIWYLQHFDAKGLLQHADMLGFMSYDLHGMWDANQPRIGKMVYGQTDIHDIENDLMPLWYDLTPADMAKVNFGVALYGRGYTLADPTCNKADGTCAWTGGSKPAMCSATEGVMSLTEIEALIAEQNLVPTALNSGHGRSMMKQITWDNQWVGYDDDETIQTKTNYASSRCFGGTMTWSVDLFSKRSDSDKGAIDGNPFTFKPVDKYGSLHSYMGMATCKDDPGNPQVADCQALVLSWLRDPHGKPCDNWDPKPNGCTSFSDRTSSGRTCDFEICGATEGTAYNCPLIAAALQRIISDCSHSWGGLGRGSIGGQVLIRASSADGKDDQMVRILSQTPSAIKGRAEAVEPSRAFESRYTDALLPRSPPWRGHLPRFRSHPIPFTGLELRFSSIMGVKNIVITQELVFRQRDLFIRDSGNVPGYSLHIGYSTAHPSGASIRLDFDFSIYYNKVTLYREDLLAAAVQGVNDYRNEMGNPSFLSASMYKFGSDDFVAQCTWQWNDQPATSEPDEEEEFFLCGADLCATSMLENCEEEPYGSVRGQEQGRSLISADSIHRLRRSDRPSQEHGVSIERLDVAKHPDSTPELFERVPKAASGVRTFTARCSNRQTNNLEEFRVMSKPYSSFGQWTDNEERYDRALDVEDFTCSNPTIGTKVVPRTNAPAGSRKYCTEHIIELQTLSMFFNDLKARKLPNYPDYSNYPTVLHLDAHCDFVRDFMNEAMLPSQQKDVYGVTTDLKMPISRIFQRIGWKDNYKVFEFLERQLNGIKARVSCHLRHFYCTGG